MNLFADALNYAYKANFNRPATQEKVPVKYLMTELLISPNHLPLACTFEPPYAETNKLVVVPSKDSDQSVHPPSLIRISTARLGSCES